MSDNQSFCCPVCRARQTLRDQCRRCKADLSLVTRARRRVAYLLEQQEMIVDTDSPQATAIATELTLLTPNGDRKQVTR